VGRSVHPVGPRDRSLDAVSALRRPLPLRAAHRVLRRARVSFLLCALGSLTGCATLFNTSRDQLPIYTASRGIRVREAGQALPISRVDDDAYRVTLNPQRPHILEIDTDRGSYTVAARRSVGAGWVVLDILCHPLICVAIDAATDAWSQYDAVRLDEQPVVARPPAPSPPRPAPWNEAPARQIVLPAMRVSIGPDPMAPDAR
jgi:hypothetical protein